MKKLALLAGIGLIASQAHAQAFKLTKADSLKIECTGTLKLEHLVKAVYDPGVPPYGRFPGIAPSENIHFKASFQNLNGDQCSLLTTKYNQDLTKLIDVYVSPKDVVGQEHVEVVAQSLVGTSASFQVNHSFGYQTDSGFLPLFPEVVRESIGLSGITDQSKDTLGGSFKIDTASIYGTTPVHQWTDDQKLVLAKHLKGVMGNLADLLYLEDFHNLFIHLEVQSPSAQKEIFYILWTKFNEAALKPYTQFFDFEVGGIGFFVGHPFATKLIQLANQVATTTEKEQLIFQFPSLLKPGGYSEKYCLNLQPENLTNVIKQWQAQAPIMVNHQFYDVKEMLTIIASGQKTTLLNHICIKNLQTDVNIEMASEALKSFQK